MKAGFAPEQFPREFALWGLRGALCATSSFWWALMAGFNAPAEIAGMVAGVVGWVAIFAGLCAWRGEKWPGRADRLVRALKVATWIRFSISALGGLGFALSSLGPKGSMTDAGIIGMMPDGWCGIVAVHLVAQVGGMNPERLAKLDSFGWTALTTLVDGALFALVIGVLATAVLLWWRFCPGLEALLRISPARRAG
jgi:hypothetical protein